jgi:1-deoxy-D-xylulose-5-phosphate reductoisomerase
VKKHVAILGSTGSIGTQALEVIQAHPEKFAVELLTANGNTDLLIRQAIKFQPGTVVIADESKRSKTFPSRYLPGTRPLHRLYKWMK